MAIAPCRNCNDRTLGCHSKCEKYNNFKKENDREKQYIKEQKEQISLYMGYVVNQKERYRRSRH